MPRQTIGARSTEADSSAFAAAFGFAVKHWLALSGISVLILVPCFWHREIVASDLGSHLYNAWLVQLIHRGQAPGLWIAPQHTNILFDILLSNLGSIFGLRAAEKLAVSLAVLTFFWGTFALISAAVRRPPLSLLPCIALITYGWTFHLGFFNYYLSLGLSFFGLALWWRGKGWERLSLLLIAPLVFIAHPLGLIWLLCAAAYIWIAETLPRRVYQWLLCIAVAALLFAVHIFISHHYAVDPGAKPFYAFNGADQLVLFGERYRILARALLAFALVSIAIDLIRRMPVPGLLKYYSIPIQLYILAMVSVLVLPGRNSFSPAHGHHRAPDREIHIDYGGDRLLPAGRNTTSKMALCRRGCDCRCLFRIPLPRYRHRQQNGGASCPVGEQTCAQPARAGHHRTISQLANIESAHHRPFVHRALF